jgi:hypothetical protein
MARSPSVLLPAPASADRLLDSVVRLLDSVVRLLLPALVAMLVSLVVLLLGLVPMLVALAPVVLLLGLVPMLVALAPVVLHDSPLSIVHLAFAVIGRFEVILRDAPEATAMVALQPMAMAAPVGTTVDGDAMVSMSTAIAAIPLPIAAAPTATPTAKSDAPISVWWSATERSGRPARLSPSSA